MNRKPRSHVCYQESRRIFWLRHYLNRLVPSLKRQGIIQSEPRLCAFPNDLIGREMAVAGRYEMAGIRAVEFLCDRGVIGSGEGSVFLDVGANIGTYAVSLAPRFGRVLSFEPHPVIARILAINLEINRCGNVVLHRVALSDHDGTAGLHDAGGDNVGASTLEDGRLSDLLESRPGHDVPLVRGDSFLASDLGDRLDFIKIDVEGHEFPAISGLAGIVGRHKPVIAFEANSGEASERLFGLLETLGYRQFLALDFHPRLANLWLRVATLTLFGVRHALVPITSLAGRSYSMVFAMSPEQAARLD